MNRNASLMVLKAKPGQRDEVRRVWEKYARDYIAGSTLGFHYCYDDADPDRIFVFGLGDPASIREFAQQPWFVDYQHDVTVKDLKLAAREGFRAIEHVKRYTTTGMATDQGKTSNLNAMAIVANHLGIFALP